MPKAKGYRPYAPPRPEKEEQKLFIISEGHVIEDFLMMKTYCGKRTSTGWRYEPPEQIGDWCQECREKMKK